MLLASFRGGSDYFATTVPVRWRSAQYLDNTTSRHRRVSDIDQLRVYSSKLARVHCWLLRTDFLNIRRKLISVDADTTQ